MWICLSNAFLSIVNSDRDPTVLMVRARRKGDIEAVFGPSVEVTTIPQRDYQFRAFIRRDIVGQVIAQALMEIDYGNFKGSTKDRHLHDAYMEIWKIMEAQQEIPAYGTKPRHGFRKHPQR
ncbi:hypothetical protein PQR46_18735 [Paraburkholderia sediminicola]|uniref:hypothetical protein n=1 Tax=Paraburkholderia sediminicola TaxID=458836 RepID=UPI0038B6FA6B